MRIILNNTTFSSTRQREQDTLLISFEKRRPEDVMTCTPLYFVPLDCQRLGLKTAGTKELMNNTESIKEWIKESGIKHLAIHIDLDVLDPKAFRSLLFANPEAPYNLAPAGTMQMPQLLNLIEELSEETDVVGLGITEHMPWDYINLKKLLGEIPILNK